MKTLSSQAEAERVKREQDVIWLLEIDWPDQTRYYATREIVIGPHLYAGMITDPGEMILSAPNDHPLENPKPDRARMRLSNRADDDPRFEALGLRHDPTGMICRIGMLFVADTVAPEDVICFQWFAVTHAAYDNRKVELTMQSMTLFDGSLRAVRVITESLAPELSREALGRALPLCFGEIDHSPLVPLRIGARARLARALEESDTVAYLSSLDGFGLAGWAQVGGELLYYAALDPEARTLGTAQSPLARLTPAAHGTGSRVASVPSEGFEYAVADHECLEVGPVYEGDAIISPLTYRIGVEDFGGQMATKVVFNRLPVSADADGEQISEDHLNARVRGWAPDGLLLESPDEIIETLLLHPRFMGLAPQQVDMASLGVAPQYCYARRVAGAETLGDLVFSAAHEARCRIVMENGVVRLSAPAADFVGPGAVFVFDSNNVFNAEMPRERSRAEDIVNAVTLWHGEDYRLGGAPMEQRFRSSFRMEDTGSQRMPWGRRAMEWPLLWHQRLLLAGAFDQWADLAGYTLARLGYKRMLARIVAPPVVAHLERGDVARIDYGGQMPGETFGEVAEARGGAMKSFEITVSANPALLDMWRSDDDTRMILCASLGHVYVHVNGARVASFDLAGCLRMRGEVIENGLGDEPMEEAIVYDADGARVLFGIGEEGNYQSVFSIDEMGDLRLRGTVEEGVDLSGELYEAEICYESAPERFAISVDGVNAALVYAADQGQLSLAGEVIEKALWL